MGANNNIDALKLKEGPAASATHWFNGKMHTGKLNLASYQNNSPEPTTPWISDEVMTYWPPQIISSLYKDLPKADFEVLVK